jgi:hypothetical protein
VQPAGGADWDAFRSSGLASELLADGLLLAFDELDPSFAATPDAVAVIRPRQLDFISYPYEWCFSQLRAAALLTLDLQARALRRGLRLRDASAYNVQFDAGRPILIDTLSFEPADPHEPWPAYRQFCEHFLAPLALVAHRDARLALLARDFIDGIPLDLAARLMPGRTRLRPGLLAHLHAHARAQGRASDRGTGTAAIRSGRPRMSRLGQDALLDSLRRTVESLRWREAGEWVDYGTQTSYTERGAASKRQIVERMIAACDGPMAWDIGANVGTYSGVAAAAGKHVLAFDQDAGSVERHWRALGEERATILPLVLDLTNPSPSLGWALAERRSILDRGPADVVMALALVHHLAIGNNLPLRRIAAVLAQMGRRVIVEFVPKEDPMTQRLLAAREDIFTDYTLDAFRAALGAELRIVEEVAVEDSLRTIFLAERRG